MIHLDISLEEWLKRYPALKGALPISCKCGVIENLKLVRSKDRVGLKAPECHVCRTGSQSVYILISEKRKRRYRDLVLSLLREG